MPRLCSSLLLSLLIVSPASAVTMAWTPIGNPGNACDPQSQGCFGAVGYAYNIGTYEVTNAQYAEFLNAKAASDPLGLYNTSMASGWGGIMQSGSSGSYTYSVIAGRSDLPVNFVSFFDAMRFANWMNNGQANGETETGAYTLQGGTSRPSNGDLVARNPGAIIFLPSQDEWYKAAYYDALSTRFFDYPAGSDAQTVCSSPTVVANSANCDFAHGDLTGVGSYTGSASPYGTFDQGGNVWEWNEVIVAGLLRGVRGGGFNDQPTLLAASDFFFFDPAGENDSFGFRLAMVPEPSTGLLVVIGLHGLAVHTRGRSPRLPRADAQCATSRTRSAPGDPFPSPLQRA